jgi:Phosphoesterase family/Calcineurin-like phosphoesterase/Bacterial Ig domain
MKKLLIFTIFACLALASCSPVINFAGIGASIGSSTAVPPAATSSPLPSNQTQVATPAQNGIPNFDHIVLIMLENRDFGTAIDPKQMPQLTALEQKYVLLTNYYAVTHPSLPNYIALMSGSTQGITSDCTNCFLNQPNLADEIEASGRTWKAYLEDLPSPCFVGDSGKYAQKHNPLIYFDSIRLNTARCDRSILPLTSLDSDLANKTLPNFIYIMPNLCNSGHDCSAAVADNWVGGMVAKLQGSQALGDNSLIIIDFDEGSDQDTAGCCGLPTPAGGQVAPVLISPSTPQGFTDNTPYSHYSMLKTILTAWKLPDLGNTAQAQPILAPWTGQVSQNSSATTPPSITPGATQASGVPTVAAIPIATPGPGNRIPSGAQAANCASSQSTSGTYTVKICFAGPASGSTLSGDVSILPAVKISGSPRSSVQDLIFYLNGVYLLTSYTSPYTFTLPTAKWQDGSYTLSVEAVMRDNFVSSQASLPVVFNNGITAQPVNPNHFTATSGRPAANGAPFLVAAGGDGASGEPTSSAVVKLIASLNPNLFLYLGDVYEDGSKAEFYNWYGTSSTFFGQFRSITDPTVGNHEYLTPDASGYFDYWDNIPSYYSFNAGGWHFISLNANAPRIPVGPGSAQYQWLQQDLAANAQTCTIVYYHEPLFNIGPEGTVSELMPMWSLMAKYGVSIVLNGHDHDYQRWVPLDGSGQPSPTGITEFVVGSAGHGIQKFVKSDSRVAYANDTEPATFGVLLLHLGQTGATFAYQSVTGAILDSGSIPCGHTSPSSMAPSLANRSGQPVLAAAGLNAVNLGADIFNWITGSTIYSNGLPYVVVPGLSLTASFTYVISSPLQAFSNSFFLQERNPQNGLASPTAPPG